MSFVALIRSACGHLSLDTLCAWSSKFGKKT